jgi:hypothetical protein
MVGLIETWYHVSVGNKAWYHVSVDNKAWYHVSVGALLPTLTSTFKVFRLLPKDTDLTVQFVSKLYSHDKFGSHDIAE